MRGWFLSYNSQELASDPATCSGLICPPIRRASKFLRRKAGGSEAFVARIASTIGTSGTISSSTVSDHGTFREVFERGVAACIKAGLVGGEGFAVDASLIEADANSQTVKGVDSQNGGAPEIQRAAEVNQNAVAPTTHDTFTEGEQSGGSLPREMSAEIGDPAFMNQLNQMIALRSFLIKQAIPVTSSRSLVPLNTLRFKRNGRFPTTDEWAELEQQTERLFGLVNEPLRRKFLSSQIPRWVPTTAISLGVLAITAFLASEVFTVLIVPVTFLVWVAALGAIGSIAFIGMNALAVQDDATFDLTNDKLIILRIVLGALFGTVLTLPFGDLSYLKFILEAGRTDLPPPGVETPKTELLQQAIMLLLPFILGFSTNLVIMILNRFVEAVQSFFGRSPPSLPAATATADALNKTVHARAVLGPDAVGDLAAHVEAPGTDAHRARAPEAPHKPRRDTPNSGLRKTDDRR
jgi:hypothetical protein